MARRGKLITFEGGEGAGKGTQLELLYTLLDDRRIKYLPIREPGGTSVGEEVREILLNPANTQLSDIAELLLYEVARAQLLAEVIQPALEGGTLVICDRFYDSTTAYQGFGRGLPLETVLALNQIATNGLRPDLTIYLDLCPEEGLSRATKNGADRIELEGLSFHERVREGFLWLGETESIRFRVIEAKGTPEEVHVRVMHEIEPMI
jgi:dTMP kinase